MKFLLTHHYQSDFPRVHTRRLLDFTLVGGCVWNCHTRNGDGGVSIRGVCYERESGGEAGVGVLVRLPSCIW